jgi:hypothetical protein
MSEYCIGCCPLYGVYLMYTAFYKLDMFPGVKREWAYCVGLNRKT